MHTQTERSAPALVRMTGDKNVIRMTAPRREKSRRVCNLCGCRYVAASRFDRFCGDCKERNELYHFHEWLAAS